MTLPGETNPTTVVQPMSGVVVVRKSARPKEAARPQPISREAQRLAAAILEVLAGVRTPTEAAEALDLSLPRYYLLEQRALEGLVAGCEPRPVGKAVSQRHQIDVLQKEVARLKQDCARQQALVRASQRTIGLNPPATAKPAKASSKPPATSNAKRPRKRKPVIRALKAVAALLSTSSVTEGESDAPSVAAAEVLQQTPEACRSPLSGVAQFAPNGL